MSGTRMSPSRLRSPFSNCLSSLVTIPSSLSLFSVLSFFLDFLLFSILSRLPFARLPSLSPFPSPRSLLVSFLSSHIPLSSCFCSLARQGKARLSKAGHDQAKQGKAVQAREGKARMGNASQGKASRDVSRGSVGVGPMVDRGPDILAARLGRARVRVVSGSDRDRVGRAGRLVAQSGEWWWNGGHVLLKGKEREGWGEENRHCLPRLELNPSLKFSKRSVGFRSHFPRALYRNLFKAGPRPPRTQRTAKRSEAKHSKAKQCNAKPSEAKQSKAKPCKATQGNAATQG